jgi:hypothetical protein
MLRAKRRRASKYNTKGKQIFSTLNTTVKYKQQLNVQNGEIKTDCSYNPVPCNCSITTIKPNNSKYKCCPPKQFVDTLPPCGYYNFSGGYDYINGGWEVTRDDDGIWGFTPPHAANPWLSSFPYSFLTFPWQVTTWTAWFPNLPPFPQETEYFNNNVHMSGVQGEFLFLTYCESTVNQIVGCKTNTQRNPLSGYRKDNILSSIADCSKIPTNTVYTDNYARNKPGQNGTGCSLVVEGSGCVYDLSSCIQYKQYNPTVQNKHGYINDAYNYSTKQYLSRRNDTYTKRAFNFLSNKNANDNKFSIKNSWDPSDNKCYNNSIYNGDLFNRWRDKDKNNRYAVYKPNNRGFSQQGAVSGGARLNRLKYQTQLKAQICCIQTPNTIENKKHNNVINGAYPATLYYNGTPVHKEIISNVKTANCKRTQSGIAQRCHIKSNFCI